MKTGPGKNFVWGKKKKKPEMAYPFLSSIIPEFENKTIYNFSQNINIEYCYNF